jgi:hypothetical protein
VQLFVEISKSFRSLSSTKLPSAIQFKVAKSSKKFHCFYIEILIEANRNLNCIFPRIFLSQRASSMWNIIHETPIKFESFRKCFLSIFSNVQFTQEFFPLSIKIKTFSISFPYFPFGKPSLKTSFWIYARHVWIWKTSFRIGKCFLPEAQSIIEVRKQIFPFQTSPLSAVQCNDMNSLPGETSSTWALIATGNCNVDLLNVHKFMLKARKKARENPDIEILVTRHVFLLGTHCMHYRFFRMISIFKTVSCDDTSGYRR